MMTLARRRLDDHTRAVVRGGAVPEDEFDATERRSLA
jgi:hypothetical protein